MKCRYYVLALLVFVVSMNFNAKAQVTESEFATVAVGTCSPLPSCAIPQRGTITCTGADTASLNLLPPWCPADSRTKVRDRLLVYSIIQTNDDRVSGTVLFRLNANLESASFSGKIWGTYHIEVPNRGAWDGTWEGTAHSNIFWTYQTVMFGSGQFEGLQLRADGVWRWGQGDMLTGTIKSTETEQQ